MIKLTCDCFIIIITERHVFGEKDEQVEFF